MDLIPPGLIVARWFAVEHAAIEKLQGAQETAARELEEFRRTVCWRTRQRPGQGHPRLP